jgi:hypothetical protein
LYDATECNPHASGKILCWNWLIKIGYLGSKPIALIFLFLASSLHLCKTWKSGVYRVQNGEKNCGLLFISFNDNSGLQVSGELTIRDKKRECFVAVYLDAKNRVIAAETLFTGTLAASAVYPREVVAAALAHRAAAVIFAHNHPSGDPAPSPDDMAITQRLAQACGVMGITVHEHLIIGTEGYFSFADHGHMARINAAVDSR